MHLVSAVILEPLNLHAAQIPNETWIVRSRFISKVDLSESHFLQGLSISSSKIAEVTLDGAQVDGDANFEDTVFLSQANFNSLEVSGWILASRTRFLRDADFSYASVNGSFQAERSCFHGNVIFNDLKTAHHAMFNASEFDGHADLTSMDIAGSLEANNTQFRDTDFSFSRVGGTFELQSSHFHNTKMVNFTNLRVGDSAFLTGAEFEGPAKFFNTDISGNLESQEVKFLASDSPNGQAGDNIVNYGNLKVGGSAYFDHAVFNRPVSLSFASFRAIDLSDVQWPSQNTETSIELDNVSFQSITAGDKPDSWRKLLELVQKAKYNTAAYTTLEASLRNEGLGVEADDVFVARKERERSHLPPELVAVSLLADYSIGFGRYPFRMGLWVLFALGVGCLVFSDKRSMERQHPDDLSGKYSPFWYSLDTLVPVVDLQSRNVWRPKTRSRWRWRYLRCHTTFGWILTTVLVAVLAGIVK